MLYFPGTSFISKINQTDKKTTTLNNNQKIQQKSKQQQQNTKQNNLLVHIFESFFFSFCIIGKMWNYNSHNVNILKIERKTTISSYQNRCWKHTAFRREKKLQVVNAVWFTFLYVHIYYLLRCYESPGKLSRSHWTKQLGLTS